MFCLDDLDVFGRQKPLLYSVSNSLLNQKLRNISCVRSMRPLPG